MIRRVGRPGLIGTMARTAVVAGTATAVTGGMTRRANERAIRDQQAEAYQQQGMAASQPMPSGDGDTVGKLRELADLRASGALSEEEFAAAKAKLI